ncbi:MAG: hypothetical protein K6E18_01485 [Lachnospiraceae bacterium]|nr:hypothetical protein [Lachnospiraceae bacterium]
MEKQIKNAIGKANKAAVICALIHYLIGFFTDRLIFQYVVFDTSDRLQTLKSIETIGVKVIYLLLLLFLWQGLFWFFTKADVLFRRIAIGYFILNVLFLILTWPGIWRMDEFGILSSATHLYPNFWQNYLTSVFYIYALMLIPVPAGVILCQQAVISLMVSHIICMAIEDADRDRSALWKTVENSSEKLPDNSPGGSVGPDGQSRMIGNKNAGFPSKSVLLLIIPFVMFPVLDSSLYPMRVSIWAFLELTVLSSSYFLYKQRRREESAAKSKDPASSDAKKLTEEDKKLSDDFSTTSVLGCGKSANYIAVICVMAAVLAVWRAEAIYYLIFFPALLVLIAKDRKAAALKREILLFLIAFVILFVPQKVGEKITSGSQYELTSMVLPLTELIRTAHENKDQEDAALLAQIDRVIDTDLVVSEAGREKNGIQLFWSEPGFQRTYQDEDFAACKAAYRQLIIKYPMVFIKERWTTFLDSSDLLMDTTQLFRDTENANYRQFRTYPLSGPILEQVRTAAVCFLEQRRPGRYNEKLPWADAVYSVIPPLVLAALLWILLAGRKKWAACFWILCSVIKVPLVFLTAPSRLFMYYYPVYLFGYCVIFYVIFRRFCVGGERKG